MHHGEGEAPRAKGLAGQVQQDERVLAPREQQHGLLQLGRDLTHDVDGLGLQGAQV
jgi:hypothetical protein